MSIRAVCSAVVLSLTAAAFGEIFTYNNVEVSNGEVEPGVWNYDYIAVSNYVEETGNPVIVFWGNEGCGHCNASERSIGSDWELNEWLAENQILLSFSINGNPQFVHTAEAKRFAKGGSAYPFIRWYWKDENGVVHDRKTTNTIYSDTFFAITKEVFAGWSPSASVGTVEIPNEPGNRLEFEAGTPSVTVKVTRRKNQASEPAWGELLAMRPDGTVFFRTDLDWDEGETEKDVVVELAGAGCTKTGDQIAVGVANDEGEITRPGYITYVTGNSAANPLWIGERKVPAAARTLMAAKGEASDYRFGEWTMDLDVATRTAAQTEGAFTLVSVQGSQWCPDCANTDRNFLDLKDRESDEQTKFQKWAAANKVALVTIDIPNFTDTEGSYATPTLLSREVFKTTLARNSYTNKYGTTVVNPSKSAIGKTAFPKETPELTGADPALTNAMARSGLGYLTRKGVSDAEAANILKRNHDLVVTNTDKGGFHRPEDSNAKRTGVPIFVLLRRDGTVAGRFTTFASVSPFKKDRDSFDAFVLRIEELMKEDGQTDNGEIANNDARTTTLTLNAAGETTPTGGTLSKCLSHADAIDVFKLVGTAQGVRQMVKISKPVAEAGDGKVSLTLQRLVNGKPETVMQRVGKDDVPVTVSGLLSEGVALEYTFKDPGEYFVAVKADTGDKGFAVDCPDSTWMAYSLETAMLIDPVESMNTLTIDPSYKTAFVRIEKGEFYCIEGLKFARDGEHGLPGDGGVPGKLEGPYNIDGAHYYRALESDIVAAPLDGSGRVSYQIWHPGEIGFGTPNTTGNALKKESARSVKENAGEVLIPVSRVNGASDAVKVSVVLDLEASENIYAADGHPRFVETPEAMTNELTWADGESGTKYHAIKILDDARFDDTCTFVFDIVMEPGDGFAELLNDTFVLTVTENDRKSAGKASFTGVTGTYFAKPATVYAREDESVTLELSRLVGSDAVVTGLVKTTYGTVDPASVEWGFHEDGVKTVTVSGVPAGQTAKVSLDKMFGGLAKGSPSSVSVVSIAKDAPEFAARAYPDEFAYAYVAVSNLYPVVNVAPGGTLSFTKLSGSLPSGLKATYDAAAQAMCLVGVPTKAATNTVVYQVVETVRNGRTTVKLPGLVTQITFVVADPAKAPAGLMPINVSCETARTLADIPMVAATSKRLAGTLTLTIPKATGKVSAKYSCAAGTVAFAAAKSWSALETEADGQFVAELEPSNKKLVGYSLKVEAFPNKQVRATLTDPAFPGETLVFEHVGMTWGDLMKARAKYATGAKDWAGYYTVALPMEKVVSEETEGYAADGTGYMTLKMADSAAKTGKMTWALTLPNGVTASGSSTLYPTGENYEIPSGEPLEIALLPVFWTKGNESFSAVLQVLRGAAARVGEWNASVLGEADAPACWRHTAAAKDAAALIGFETEHGVYGGLYDTKADLGGCCHDAYETIDLGLSVSVTNLVSGKYGAFLPVANPVAQVKVEAAKLTVDTSWNPQSVKISVARGTGLVTGSLKLQYVDPAKGVKDLQVSFKGILLQGWGNACGCGEDVVPVEQPFVCGSWLLSDTISYAKPGATRPSTVTDKRGAAFKVDKAGE